MTICFISNYLTHHQLPFCRELYDKLGEDFRFLATDEMEEERRNMGWALEPRSYPWYVYYEDDYDISHALVEESDVVICGGADGSFLDKRMGRGKLTFRYFERLYKTGRWHALAPRGYMRKWKEHTARRRENMYLLCAGAYVAGDFALHFAYPGKKLKWGYFPEFREYTTEELRRPERKAPEILWCGRMLDWKHPEDAVFVAQRLKEEGISFHMTIVGEGEQSEKVFREIGELGVVEEVERLHFLSPEEIRQRMLQADIYLLTSDWEEGWGAVVNEAMNAGCAVVACDAAGSVPYLIRDGENGLTYGEGDRERLFQNVQELCRREVFRKNLGQAAYETIRDVWNASVGAERFIHCAGKLLAGEKWEAETAGPLSEA